MGQFDRQIATATRLIEKNGHDVTWRQLGRGLPDADKPWRPASATNTDYTVTICFLSPGRTGQELFRYLTKTEVTTGAVNGLMSSVPFVPSVADVVIRDGETLRIKSIDVLSPNGQIILYTIEFAQ